MSHRAPRPLSSIHLSGAQWAEGHGHNGKWLPACADAAPWAPLKASPLLELTAPPAPSRKPASLTQGPAHYFPSQLLSFLKAAEDNVPLLCPPPPPTPHCCCPPSTPSPFTPVERRQQSPNERPRLCQGEEAGPGGCSLSLWLQLRSQGPLMTFVSSQ